MIAWRRAKGGAMPTYVVLMNWTDQGAKTAADTLDRYQAGKADLEQHGVTVKDAYWTVGPYDVVTIMEAADDETAVAGLVRLAAAGNVRTTSMRAFTADETRSVIEKSR
jgi:uncharacterized protein with GYD domain